MDRIDSTWRVPDPIPLEADAVGAFLQARSLTAAQLLQPERGDASRMRGMSTAVQILAEALRGGRTMAVFGDYDCDGVCSAAVMTRGLRAFAEQSGGGRVIAMVPPRAHGYGLNAGAVDRLAQAGVEVLVTTDNGTNAAAAVVRAQGYGMQVVVTDHHPLQPGLVSRPEALVNPSHPMSECGLAGLCGAGVAYKVIEQLAAAGFGSPPPELLPLVALATVADMVPMLGENRVLVRDGLHLAATVPGLAALLRRSQTSRVTETVAAFDLAPVLNAPGRMEDPASGVSGDPTSALRLLMADSEELVEALADELWQLNQKRKQIEQAARLLGHDMASRLPEDDLAIVLVDERIPPGVAGLVAGRLAEAYGRPAFVGALRPDGVISGSARTAAGVDCAAVLDAARGSLISGGGHRAAVGFRLKAEQLKAFEGAIKQEAARQMVAGPMREVLVDVSVPRLLTASEIDRLEGLAPFGQGIKPAVFMTEAVTVARRRVSQKGFMSVDLQDQAGRMPGFAFEAADVSVGEVCSAIYSWEPGRGLRLHGLRSASPAVEISSDLAPVVGF